MGSNPSLRTRFLIRRSCRSNITPLLHSNGSSQCSDVLGPTWEFGEKAPEWGQLSYSGNFPQYESWFYSRKCYSHVDPSIVLLVSTDIKERLLSDIASASLSIDIPSTYGVLSLLLTNTNTQRSLNTQLKPHKWTDMRPVVERHKQWHGRACPTSISHCHDH
jgi:hypothetical protein